MGTTILKFVQQYPDIKAIEVFAGTHGGEMPLKPINLAGLPAASPQQANRFLTCPSNSLPRLGRVFALILLGPSLAHQVRGQSPDSAKVVRLVDGADILADDPRPMKAIVVALGAQLGWAVDYEDPPHSKDSADVSDMTDPTWRLTHPDNLFFGLRNGSFATHLSGIEFASTTAPIKTVERIVSEYGQGLAPGRFFVRTGMGDRVAVVGMAARNASGEYEKTPVVLDTTLELSSSKTDLVDAFSAFTAALTKASGRKVVVGTIPINLFNQVQCVLPSEKMPARVLLGKLLENSPAKLSYLLLYDPNDNFYALNVLPIKYNNLTNQR